MRAAIRRSRHLLGAILLITGTTIGVAMIALPVVTGLSGFIPSLFVMFAVWFYLLFAVSDGMSRASRPDFLERLLEDLIRIFAVQANYDAFQARGSLYVFCNGLQHNVCTPVYGIPENPRADGRKRNGYKVVLLCHAQAAQDR